MLGVYAFRIVQAWEILEPIIPIARYGVGDGVWENFEYLYIRAKAWTKNHPEGSFPKHIQRVKLPPVPAYLTHSNGEVGDISFTGDAR